MPSLIQVASNFEQGATGAFSATASQHFNAPTTAGDLLVCLVTAEATDNSPNVPTAPTISTPVTPGVTWLLAGYMPNPGVTPGVFGARGIESCAIFYALNAPSLSDVTDTSVTATTTLSTSACNVTFEIQEYPSWGAVDSVVTGSGQSGTPTCGNIEATGNDLVVVLNANGTSTAGSGYNVPSTTFPVFCQYQNVSPGAISTAFGAASAPGYYWSAVAVAFATPILVVSPLALGFTGVQGEASPPSQNISISNGNGGPLDWSASSDSAWLPDSGSGTGDSTFQVGVDIAGLTVGVYVGHITVSAVGALDSPQIVTVTLTIVLGSACIPAGGNGAYFSDLQLYVGPATALYESPIPGQAIATNESYNQGRTAIIIDFNDSEGVYARDMGVVFSWPISSGTILDLWQPSIIPLDEDIHQRLSFHFLMKSLGGVGWQHAREMNVAYNSTDPVTLLLTFDQWPSITITLPSSNGSEIKTKVVLPPNKWKLIEGFLSCSVPFLFWSNDMELKIGTWGRTDGYRVLKPFSA